MATEDKKRRKKKAAEPSEDPQIQDPSEELEDPEFAAEASDEAFSLDELDSADEGSSDLDELDSADKGSSDDDEAFSLDESDSIDEVPSDGDQAFSLDELESDDDDSLDDDLVEEGSIDDDSLSDEGEELSLIAVEPSADGKQGLMRWDEALNLEAQVEAILFAAPKPLSASEVSEILEDDDGVQPDPQGIEAIIYNLVKLYRERNGGFRLEHDRGVGYQFRTVPAAAPLMERMFSSRQRALSRAALETLAIIAYRQPVTRADVEFIRGVDAGSIIKNLLERDLILCVGRKEDAGRPMMFGTTAEFLRVFRLPTLNDLPPLSAFQPSPDMMSEALQKLEGQDEEVEVEEFIGDASKDKPEVSEGLENISDLSDFAPEAFGVREDGTKDKADGVRRVGGSFDKEGFSSDDGDESTEVAFPDGDSFEAGSGENVDRGPDQHKRQDRPRTREEDQSGE